MRGHVLVTMNWGNKITEVKAVNTAKGAQKRTKHRKEPYDSQSPKLKVRDEANNLRTSRLWGCVLFAPRPLN